MRRAGWHARSGAGWRCALPMRRVWAADGAGGRQQTASGAAAQASPAHVPAEPYSFLTLGSFAAPPATRTLLLSFPSLAAAAWPPAATGTWWWAPTTARCVGKHSWGCWGGVKPKGWAGVGDVRGPKFSGGVGQTSLLTRAPQPDRHYARCCCPARLCRPLLLPCPPAGAAVQREDADPGQDLHPGHGPAHHRGGRDVRRCAGGRAGGGEAQGCCLAAESDCSLLDYAT